MSAPDEPAASAGSLSLFCRRHEVKIAWAEVAILFLALIRTITACYLLKTLPGNLLPAGQVQPLITGALLAALFCGALTLLLVSGRRRAMHPVFALAITSLVLVKIFLMPG
jgi:sugar phosphate permease